ncbi:hypothetical protein QYF36_005868 [Acer negundo]|nr:hypothetical protein QYF36_005868 [Acer negundo]
MDEISLRHVANQAVWGIAPPQMEVNLLENLSCYLITWEARSEKRKATGHSFEPARKIPKELAFVDFSSDEESGLVDLREEADIPVVEAVNKYTSKDESLSLVLSNANHEVRVGFGLRVMVLLADIVAINEARKIVIVGVGGGAVVDWLLEMVAIGKDECGTHAESTPATTLTISFSSASPHLAAVRRRSSLRSSTQRLFSFLASYRHTYGSNLFEYRTKNKESCISYIVYKRPTS